MYCPSCGSEISDNARYCEYCGTEQSISKEQSESRTYSSRKIEINVNTPHSTDYTYYEGSTVSPKSQLVLLLLWFFFGVFGVHYFYAGRIGMGLLWLFTGGLFGIGWCIDLIVILSGSFQDSFGRPIVIF
ncbi:MAG: TM2 domain-containing protein [Candidatus Lokiarchaeota archaeon]|nr:TM2 domain-containing protein [Candidatus Lokiarchaeota archaeon]